MNNNDYVNLLKEKIKYVDDSELVYLIEKITNYIFNKNSNNNSG